MKNFYSKVFNDAAKAVNKITNKICCCLLCFFNSQSNEESEDKIICNNQMDISENIIINKPIQDEISILAIKRRLGKISGSLNDLNRDQSNKSNKSSNNFKINKNNTNEEKNEIGLNEHKKEIGNTNRNSIFSSLSNNFYNITPENIKDIIPIIGKSLLLFSRNNKFRKIIWLIVTRSKIYEYFNMLCILLSLIVLIIDNSFLSDKSTMKILFYMDCFTNFTFLIEFLFKIISFGLLFNGVYSYLRNFLNVLDLGSLVVSIIYIIVNSYNIFNDGNSGMHRIFST